MAKTYLDGIVKLSKDNHRRFSDGRHNSRNPPFYSVNVAAAHDFSRVFRCVV
jgi:hypothetical protein